MEHLAFNLLVRARSHEFTKLEAWLGREILCYESIALAHFTSKEKEN